MGRLISAALLLYPRAVRHGHAEEIESLVTDLIEHEGRSRPAVIGRLAMDGLVQRLTSRATAWAVAAGVALTSFGGLVVSDFAAASARPATPIRAHHAAATPARPAVSGQLTTGHLRLHRERRTALSAGRLG